MSPRDPTDTLARLWDDVPVGAPPLDELVLGGQKLRRRRRLRAAGGVAALTLAVLGGTAAVTGSLLGDDPARTDEVTGADAPTAPPGHRLVGLRQVALAVPAGWRTNALDECGRPAAATVRFQLEDPAPSFDGDCPSPRRRAPSVTFTTVDTEAGRQAVKAARASTGDGNVLRGRFVCPPTADCSFSPSEAPRYLVVPSEGVAVILSGPERSQPLLDRVAGSVQVLPEGWTTVPHVEGWHALEWGMALAEVGLDADCGSQGVCEDSRPVDPRPAVGEVVEVGSTVELYPPQ